METQIDTNEYMVKILTGEIDDAESKAVLRTLMGSGNDTNGEILIGALIGTPYPPDASTKAIVCPSLIYANLGPGIPYVLRLVSRGKVPEGSRQRLLHATARLGVPLYYHILPDLPEYAAFPLDLPQINQMKQSGIVSDYPENRVLHHLSTKTSPDSTTAQHVSVPGKPAPNILITRADGKDLSHHQVKVMWMYLHVGLAHSYPEEPLHSHLTPEKFTEFWNKTELPSGEECPVTLACKACGKDNGKLLKCGKCSVVKYCDVECQKGDWAAHRKVCVKG